MNEHMSQIAELYTRILQLEILQRAHPERDNRAICDHIQILRKRVLELRSFSVSNSSHWSDAPGFERSRFVSNA